MVPRRLMKALKGLSNTLRGLDHIRLDKILNGFDNVLKTYTRNKDLTKALKGINTALKGLLNTFRGP